MSPVCPSPPPCYRTSLRTDNRHRTTDDGLGGQEPGVQLGSGGLASVVPPLSSVRLLIFHGSPAANSGFQSTFHSGPRHGEACIQHSPTDDRGGLPQTRSRKATGLFFILMAKGREFSGAVPIFLGDIHVFPNIKK